MTPEELKAKRLELGLTQTQLGERLGVTLRAVQYYEAGQRPISRTIELLLGVISNPHG